MVKYSMSRQLKACFRTASCMAEPVGNMKNARKSTKNKYRAPRSAPFRLRALLPLLGRPLMMPWWIVWSAPLPDRKCGRAEMEREPCYRSFCLPSPQRSCIVCSPEDGGVRGTGGGVLGPCSDSVHAELQTPLPTLPTHHPSFPCASGSNWKRPTKQPRKQFGNLVPLWSPDWGNETGMQRKKRYNLISHTHTHTQIQSKKKREQPDGTADRNRRARTGRTSCRRQVAALVASDGSWGAVEGCFRSGFRIDDRDLWMVSSPSIRSHPYGEMARAHAQRSNVNKADSMPRANDRPKWMK